MSPRKEDSALWSICALIPISLAMATCFLAAGMGCGTVPPGTPGGLGALGAGLPEGLSAKEPYQRARHIEEVVIAGAVLDQEGMGVSGVVVSADNDDPTAITNEDGSYAIEDLPGWGWGRVNVSGRVTRPLAGGGEGPFVGVELAFEGISPIPDLPSVTTDLSGEYSQILPVGWSGTIRAADTDSFVLASTADPGSDSRSYSIPVPPAPLPPPYLNQNFTGVRNYYVATTGSDSSNGTVDDEFSTIQHAADVVLPGDSVFIREGIYDTSSYPTGGWEATPTLHTVVDGTDTAPIRFEGIGPGLVTFDARAINRNCVSIETDYTTVSKVKLIGAKREGGTIFASWRTTGSPQPTTGPPVFTGTPSGRKVEGSKFVECIATGNSVEANSFSAGFLIHGQCTECAIEYCMSSENGQGIDISERDAVNTFRTYPLYQAPWPDAVRNCTVRRNIAFDNRTNDENSDGIAGRYATGCMYQDNVAFGNGDDNYDVSGAVACTYDGNIAFDANPADTLDGDGNGIKISTREGGGNTIRNNISFLNPRGGFDDDDGTDNRYYNNVAYRNNYGMVVESDIGPNALVNNLAYLNVARDMTLSQDCPAAPPFASNPSDYNYWGDGRPPFDPCNAGLPFDDANSLAFGANPNGLTAVGDPLFVNPIDDVSDLDLSALDTVAPGGIQAVLEDIQNQVRSAFALQTVAGGFAADSPCLDAGTDVGRSFNGGGPDIGAYECEDLREPVTCLRGDGNGDGAVDGLDIQAMVACLLDPAPGYECACLDMDLDDSITLRGDFPCFAVVLLGNDDCVVDCQAPLGGGPALQDCNGNGIADLTDTFFDTSLDCNNNFTPDECDIDPSDPDTNGEISNDLNENSIPDECEPDCNENGTPDDKDIADQASEDVNSNAIPDECEPDCNQNGSPDEWGIDQGTSGDCNGNGRPDECELDCNENGVSDDCDADPSDPDGDGQVSEDCNSNGWLDECERRWFPDLPEC